MFSFFHSRQLCNAQYGMAIVRKTQNLERAIKLMNIIFQHTHMSELYIDKLQTPCRTNTCNLKPNALIHYRSEHHALVKHDQDRFTRDVIFSFLNLGKELVSIKVGNGLHQTAQDLPVIRSCLSCLWPCVNSVL